MWSNWSACNCLLGRWSHCLHNGGSAGLIISLKCMYIHVPNTIQTTTCIYMHIPKNTQTHTHTHTHTRNTTVHDPMPASILYLVSRGHVALRWPSSHWHTTRGTVASTVASPLAISTTALRGGWEGGREGGRESYSYPIPQHYTQPAAVIQYHNITHNQPYNTIRVVWHETISNRQ